MTQDRRHLIDAWLQAALELDDESERQRLLDRGCPQDLRHDVDRLLDACAGPDALPPVARLRIEALYAIDCEQTVESSGKRSDAVDDVEAGPRSPWCRQGDVQSRD